MKKTLSAIVANYLKAHGQKKRWKQIVSVLACVVVFCTTYALILPAITMTGAYCGKEEHTHSADAGCYAEGEAHVHTDECYEEERVLSCGLTETEGHTHDESCYDEEYNLICGQEEAEAHTHTEDCYAVQKTLVCGKEEGETESVLTCDQEEHTHTLACYSDPDADLDAPELPERSGNAAADAAAIAKKQLGYTQSTKNYLVAADGETIYGYTCYGAAYGDSYTPDWSALFARYCLDQAGVSEDFPRAKTCERWISMLAEQEMYQDTSYTPNPGDVAFFDLDGDGAADHAGIVLDADDAAVGAVTVQDDEADEAQSAVASISLESAVGFGTLPVKSPMKVTNAEPGKPSFDLTFSEGGHGENDERLYYTGETFTATLNLSDNAQDGAQTSEDDGTVARVYMRFAKTIPDNENGVSSADGMPSVTGKGSITAGGSGHQYAYTVTRIAGSDRNHYTYCFEIQRPINGDTLSISLPCAYPSPTSAGGTVEVWGMLLTKEEKEALDSGSSTPAIQEPEDGNVATARWETKPNDFALTKTNATSSRLPMVGSDSDGKEMITRLQYHVNIKRDTTTELEGMGKDHVMSVDFTDTFTLPENTHFDPEVIDAIKNHTYVYSKSVQDTTSGSDYYNYHYYVTPETKKHVFAISFEYSSIDNKSFTVPELSISEDGRTVTVSWTKKNVNSNGSSLYLSSELANVSVGIMLPDVYMEKLEENLTYTVQNNVSATYHYCWSEDKTDTASCENTVQLGAAKMSYYKHMSATLFGNMQIYCDISATNSGSLPYEHLAFIKDPLPSYLYMDADSLAAAFTDADYGKGFSVEIVNAAVCDGKSLEVKTTDGGSAIATVTNVSPDVDGKYSGLWTGSDDTILTKTATFTLGWNDDKTKIVIARSGDGISSQPRICVPTADAIQAALDELGLYVINETRYQVQWDLRDENGKPSVVHANQALKIRLYCNGKDTFMRLTADRKNAYTAGSFRYYNTAEYQNENSEKIGSAQAYDNIWREIEFYKSVAALDGSEITESNVPQDGGAVTYSLQLKHSGNGSYDLLPLVDHMTGAQVLLAGKEANKDAEWASGCETVTVDGTEYYKLNTPGTYTGVWINGLYADSVVVSASTSGRDTLIKWYFKDYDVGSKTQTFTYHALVCPQELAVSGMTFTLNNESWLNDHVAHRLYADIGGEITGSTVEFNKRIVSAADFGAAEKEEGQTQSIVGEGETVYYRISIYPSQVGGEDTDATLTLHGKDLRDSLPLSYSKNGTDYLKWHKSDDQTAGSVCILGYEGATNISNEEIWDIQDDGVANQQNLIWDDDFSVTFPANRPLYIYIRLTFPSGENWQEYAAQYGQTSLENTFSLSGIPSVVTHDIKLEAKAYLQKGVYMNGYWYSNSRRFEKNQDLTVYSNSKGSGSNSNYTKLVEYYVAVCNEGNTRLYISELQDILPDGFTLYGYTISSSDVAVQCTSGRSFKWLSFNLSVVTDSDNPQKLTWKFTTSSNSKRYDASRNMCYLNPGEGICFGYYANVSKNYADTQDTATNCVAMPYYDYNNGGVRLSDTQLTRADSYYRNYVDVPNDGDCRLIDNTQAVSAGFTGVSNETQWLYSEVTQYRGEIKPGITKRLAAAISPTTGTTENPIAARSEDTLRWELEIYNDGSNFMSDYIVTDVMQYPYSYTGTVKWGTNDLFKISFTPGNTSGQIAQRDIAVNGEWVHYGSLYVRLTHDEATGNYALSIRFEGTGYAISPGETKKLTIDTKRFDGGNENTVFVNTCYVTPSAEQAGDWDGTTNHGNVTAYDPEGMDENRLSVRNSAPVTTAYGFATSSRKDVAQTDDLTNSATGNDGTNYIVLPDLTTKGVTYTLNVDAPDDVPMTSLVLIDTLPYVGDHSSFQSDDPRFSEFSVNFADHPNVTVKVTDKDGNVTTLDPSQYTVRYSDLTEFSKEDWRGTSTAVWQASPAGMRTLRVAITDENAIPANSHVSVSFNAVVGEEADYGQSAWNSFGYHYTVGSGVELEAAPLKVGVKMPTRPYLQKSLVDRDSKSTTAKQDETFRFLLYSGQSLKTTDVAEIAAKSSAVTVIDLTVPQGESASEELMLKDLKVWDYTDGQWTQTDTDWTWTHNGYYTLVELPQSDDPEYRFQSINRRTDETGYQFVYQYDQTQLISAVNLHDVWPLTIRKVDQDNPDLTIAGAWFALYSPYESDKLDYDALTDKPTTKPAETIEQDGQTWYLARVAQTGNVESERGSLTWSDLRRETYLYQEIQSPKGYMLDPTIRTVTKNGSAQTVTVTNEGAGYELPQTGGPGRLPFFLSGLLLIGGSALVLCRRRKRKGAA